MRREAGLLLSLLLLAYPLIAFGAVAPEEPLDLRRLRDPFKRPPAETVVSKAKSELDEVSVDQLKLVGVITGPSKIRAIVKAPSGKIFVLAEGQVVGRRSGRVRRIYEDRILIEESIVDFLGGREIITSEVMILPEARVAGRDGPGVAKTVTEIEGPLVLLPSQESQARKQAQAQSQAQAQAQSQAQAQAQSQAQAQAQSQAQAQAQSQAQAQAQAPGQLQAPSSQEMNDQVKKAAELRAKQLQGQ